MLACMRCKHAFRARQRKPHQAVQMHPSNAGQVMAAKSAAMHTRLRAQPAALLAPCAPCSQPAAGGLALHKAARPPRKQCRTTVLTSSLDLWPRPTALTLTFLPSHTSSGLADEPAVALLDIPAIPAIWAPSWHLLGTPSHLALVPSKGRRPPPAPPPPASAAAPHLRAPELLPLGGGGGEMPTTLCCFRIWPIRSPRLLPTNRPTSLPLLWRRQGGQHRSASVSIGQLERSLLTHRQTRRVEHAARCTCGCDCWPAACDCCPAHLKNKKVGTSTTLSSCSMARVSAFSSPIRRAKLAKPWKDRARASTAGKMCTQPAAPFRETSTTVSTWGAWARLEVRG
jgi:hypothetical protein